MQINRKYLAGITVVLAALAMVPSLVAEDAAAASIKVMSYNLRFASSEGTNSWQSRRPLMAELLREKQPDLMGTQEGLLQQLNDLQADLPGYSRIGVGREGGDKGEFSAIFFRTNRLEASETGNFWLSDTPDTAGSTSWGNKLPRMATWGRFHDRIANCDFYYLNTHLDHQSQSARERGNYLIRKTIESWKTVLPVIVSGDFNAEAEKNPAYDVLVKDGFMIDTWLSAPVRSELVSTFNGFRGIDKQGIRIDWVLTRGQLKARSADIITFSKDGRFPSDHFPYLTTLEYVK